MPQCILICHDQLQHITIVLTSQQKDGPACTIYAPSNLANISLKFAVTLQASYHGVPMVGMPLFAEQPDNIARAVERGYALSVSVKKLHTLAADLEKALKRVLTEPSFASMAAGVSDIMKAHRQSPVQVAAGKICC